MALAPESRHKGFTLIEVLIAITLLGIMVVLLFSSLKICADSWEKGESKMADVNEVAIVYNFFQRHLSTTLPLWNDLPEGEKTFSFQGKPQSLQFISAFPASAGKSGLQLFSLHLQEEDNEQIIKVALSPFVPEARGEEKHKEEVTLIKHVSDLRLAYFGSEDGAKEGIWANEWLEKSVLPRLVKINIKLDNGIFWPEMIFDLKITGTLDNEGLEPGFNNNTNNSNDINNPQSADDPGAGE
ncbi:MAG: prepilin-type N-terminal cleavage/methylation domain-containing protein [Methylococcales bacterium]|nr:prepilin-type N-terminal cleavage/methylation domain-containing protein [Methylococcales bacterium]